jgi:hypothetical protein
MSGAPVAASTTRTVYAAALLGAGRDWATNADSGTPLVITIAAHSTRV